MDIEVIVINSRNWIISAQGGDYWRPCKCGIELKGLLSYGVGQLKLQERDLKQGVEVDKRTILETTLKKQL